MTNRILILCIAALTISFTVSAQEEQKPKTPEEMAIAQTNRLEIDLKLEPHQTFYVDSILTANYRGWDDEMQAMRRSGTQEFVVYKQINDKWGACIDSALHKVLDDEQWFQYLKQSGKLKKEKKVKKSKKSKDKEQ